MKACVVGWESEECENVGYGMKVLKLRFGGILDLIRRKKTLEWSA